MRKRRIGTAKFFTLLLLLYHTSAKLQLIKETDNKADKEAIRVELEGLGKVGYVANSPHSVIGNSYSAGRLYDKIGDLAEGKVLYVLPQGVLCSLVQEEKGEKA